MDSALSWCRYGESEVTGETDEAYESSSHAAQDCWEAMLLVEILCSCNAVCQLASSRCEPKVSPPAAWAVAQIT